MFWDWVFGTLKHPSKKDFVNDCRHSESTLDYPFYRPDNGKQGSNSKRKNKKREQ